MEESVEDMDKKEDENNDEQNTDVHFVYNDADEYAVEIAELYSYSEEPDFHYNRQCFEEYFKRFVTTKWIESSQVQKHNHLKRLFERLESGHSEVRHKATRSLLYLLQGNFGECDLEEDQLMWTRRNVYLCLEAGLFSTITQLLLFEVEYNKWTLPNSQDDVVGDSVSCGLMETDAGPNRSTMSNSANLRVILSILYIIVETVRDDAVRNSVSDMEPTTTCCVLSGHPEEAVTVHCNILTDEVIRRKLRERLVDDLITPLIERGEATLTVVLFGMVNRFCSGLAPYFPMKKVLLLLWKVLLVTLVPVTGLYERKNASRARFNLPPLFEDTYQVVKRMRASSPPESSADKVLGRTHRSNNRVTSHPSNYMSSARVPRRGSLAHIRTAPAFDVNDALAGFFESRPHSPINDVSTGRDTPMPSADIQSVGDLGLPCHTHRGIDDVLHNTKFLPWKPKVGKKDIEHFLTGARMKFVGFQVPNDTVSLLGLPQPIHEAVNVMHEHLYVSLAEKQIQREDLINRNPMSLGKEDIPAVPAERLYRATYPLLPHYVIALLKILLAAVPTARTKTEPINLLGELTPEKPFASTLHAEIFAFDVNRHRELVVKAVSALLLLLLKNMKLNHIYQFEYISQYMVFANCIPLILKFFNQNVCHYVQAKNTLPFLDFPARLFGDPPELTHEMLVTDATLYCWRNIFSCINLLRILNMLTKWKHARIILLVVYKSSPILKRALRVRQPMMQLYVLKLLKLQSRYLGRQWRKNNMSILSVIYRKVRHRLVDDWAYGSDVDSMPIQFQTEECNLRANVDAFNRRRYSFTAVESDLQPVDNCLMSVLNQPLELSDEFKQNYEKWLEEEVFSVPINWTHVLAR